MLFAALSVGCIKPNNADTGFATNNGAGTGSDSDGGKGGSSSNGNGGNGNGGGGSNAPVNLPGTCKDPWAPGKKYHPDGYADSAVHGQDAKLQADTCQTCHGDTLEGCMGAVSCNNCHDGGHPDGWRTKCNYCHGTDDTGAPPSDLDRSVPDDKITFTAHAKHIKGDSHGDFDCNQCHTKPVDILSPGHMFDDTPGHAEVNFSGGLSKAGKFAGPGSASCSSLYCHGSGLAPGEYAVSKGPTTCETCHGTKDLKRLTYDHDRHINSIRKFEAITCASCHPNADKDGKLTDKGTHVDGKIDVKITGVMYDPAKKTCSGTCHTSYPHNGAVWQEKGGLFGG